MSKAIKNFFLFLPNGIKFYLHLGALLVSLAGALITFHRDARLKIQLVKVLRSIILTLKTPHKEAVKTTEDSKSIYNEYDDRDIKDHLSNKLELVLYNNKVVAVSDKQRRLSQLNYLFDQINIILKSQNTVSVLEVGCGNLINIYETKLVYGDKVDFYGLEIAANRIQIGKSYFKELTEPDHYLVQSITEKTPFADNQFDIVFSMHCLEQISYDTKQAISEMYRICRKKVVMIEPVFENGNFLQRAYLMEADHTRILLRSINELNFPISINQSCAMQAGISNQSSLVIIDK